MVEGIRECMTWLEKLNWNIEKSGRVNMHFHSHHHLQDKCRHVGERQVSAREGKA